MSEIVVEIVESKKDEIIEKVVEQIEEKKEEIEKKADEAEAVIEKAADEVGKKIEEVAKPLTDLIDKLDDNPQVAKALDIIEDQLDGREISCSCFGWLVALRISRKMKETPPSKPEEIPKSVSSEPSQQTEVKVESPPTAPQS